MSPCIYKFTIADILQSYHARTRLSVMLRLKIRAKRSVDNCTGTITQGTKRDRWTILAYYGFKGGGAHKLKILVGMFKGSESGIESGELLLDRSYNP